MNRYILLLLAGSLVFITMNGYAQKTVVARYSGGHGCVDLALRLYSDSTYELETNSGIMFNIRSVQYPFG
jgi:hypothetical protein